MSLSARVELAPPSAPYPALRATFPPVGHMLKVKGGVNSFEHYTNFGGLRSPLPPFLRGEKKNTSVAESYATNCSFSSVPHIWGAVAEGDRGSRA